jgi:gas vesicle protein
VYRESSNSDLLVGLLVGTIAGVAIGMLLAPKAGSETREMLREGFAQGMERIKQMCNAQG